MLSDDGIFYEQWVEMLPACLMAMRFLGHKTLGYAPFTVNHGLLPRVPLQDY